MKQRRTTPTEIIPIDKSWDYQPSRPEVGFDCVHLAGVIDGRYTACDESLEKPCECYGCRHDKKIPGLGAQIIERRKAAIPDSAVGQPATGLPARPVVQTSTS